MPKICSEITVMMGVQGYFFNKTYLDGWHCARSALYELMMVPALSSNTRRPRFIINSEGTPYGVD